MTVRRKVCDRVRQIENRIIGTNSTFEVLSKQTTALPLSNDVQMRPPVKYSLNSLYWLNSF